MDVYLQTVDQLCVAIAVATGAPFVPHARRRVLSELLLRSWYLTWGHERINESNAWISCGILKSHGIIEQCQGYPVPPTLPSHRKNILLFLQDNGDDPKKA